MNNGIPDEEASISYDRFHCAVRDLCDSGQHSLMIKIGLEDAFRHIGLAASWIYMVAEIFL